MNRKTRISSAASAVVGVAILAGVAVTAPRATAATGQVSSPANTTTTLPPDPMKLCLLKTFALRSAVKNQVSVASNQSSTASDFANAAARVQDAEDNLFRCLNGSAW